MKALFSLFLGLSLVTGAHAEIFGPRVAGGRGPHIAHGGHSRMAPHAFFAGNVHGPHFGLAGHGRHHDAHWRFGYGWTAPVVGFSLGYYDDFYGSWYGGPRWNRWAGWYDVPVYRPPTRIVAAPYYANRVTAYAAGSGTTQRVYDDIRDSRSPEQLRAIYGAQAEMLIRSQ
ncbi:MAG: hypothetical protein HZA31_04050 [Opitutae bacterium]|nr:hypothetical protein [Opitutae bacterium]